MPSNWRRRGCLYIDVFIRTIGWIRGICHRLFFFQYVFHVFIYFGQVLRPQDECAFAIVDILNLKLKDFLEHSVAASDVAEYAYCQQYIMVHPDHC